MHPPDFGKDTILLLLLFFLYANAEICPVENPTESPADTENGNNVIGPAKRLMLKSKTCPDFKDEADQNNCCPSRITFGSYYCCTVSKR